MPAGGRSWGGFGTSSEGAERGVVERKRHEWSFLDSSAGIGSLSAIAGILIGAGATLLDINSEGSGVKLYIFANIGTQNRRFASPR